MFIKTLVIAYYYYYVVLNVIFKYLLLSFLDDKHDGDLKRVINLTAECLVNLMMSSPKNCKVFKECGGAQVLYLILEYPSTRQYATGNLLLYCMVLYLISIINQLTIIFF